MVTKNIVDFGTLLNLRLALADGNIEKAKKIADQLTEQQSKTWQQMAPDEHDKLEGELFLKRVYSDKTRPETVEQFITKYTMSNEDGFYTPHEEIYPTKKAAHAEFESRGWPDHADKEKAHPKMRTWLELPYGHICQHCGGSMVAVIQLDDEGNVLETTLADCG